jgi:signal transduction histidine kinase
MFKKYLQRWLHEQLFQQVPMRIAVIDPDLNIVHTNPSFAATSGEWSGRKCYRVYKGRKGPCSDCPAKLTFADGEVRVAEEQGTDSVGADTAYVVHVAPIVADDGSIPYVVEMSTDITYLKRLEREKLEAERLAAVGQTVAGLAHSVKNMLMGLEGGMYYLSSGLKKNNQARIQQGWEMVERNLTKTTSLVKDFLSFAKGRPPATRRVDPNALAQEIVDLYRETAAQSGVRLSAELSPGLAPAPLDPDGIHTCLTNLVSNAIDACQMSDRPVTHVTVRVREQDRTLIYEVIDDGAGMDYDVKQKVFASFFTTKGGEGTGLGLLTTRKIVQQHGGTIEVESRPGLGSLFRVSLPRDRLPPPQEEEARGP